MSVVLSLHYGGLLYIRYYIPMNQRKVLHKFTIISNHETISKVNTIMLIVLRNKQYRSYSSLSGQGFYYAN